MEYAIRNAGHWEKDMTFQIDFEPIGRRVTCEMGATLLDAAQRGRCDVDGGVRRRRLVRAMYRPCDARQRVVAEFRLKSLS